MKVGFVRVNNNMKKIIFLLHNIIKYNFRMNIYAIKNNKL